MIPENYNWADCGQPSDYCREIYEFCLKNQFKNGLEVGLDSGSSALAFLFACPEAKLVSLDKRCLHQATDLLHKHGVIDRWRFMEGDSKETLKLFTEHLFDYIYIDGDHLWGCYTDIVLSDPLLKKGGYMFFDDYVKDHGHFKVWESVQKFYNENKGRYELIEGFNLNPHQSCALKKL